MGVSKYLTVDMLTGHDLPGFQKHLRKALDAESQKEGDPTPSASAATQFGLVMTRAQQCIQKQIEHEEQLQQERDEPIAHSLDTSCQESETEEGSMPDTEGESALSLLFDVAAKEKSAQPDSTPNDVNNLVPEPALSQEGDAIFNTISPEKLKEHQKSEPTLEVVRDKSEKRDNPYFCKEGILM